MAKFKKQCRSDFTVVNNEMIKDKTLGFAEKGLLLTMLSLPENWNFSIKGLTTLAPDGEHKVSSSLKKLEQKGYLKRERIHSDNGRFLDWLYTFSDEPIFASESNEENVEKSSTEHDKNYVENNVENSDFIKKSVNPPDSENRNVVDLPKNPSPHCGFPDVDNADLENRNAYKINNNKINNNKINNNKYLSHQVSSSREISTNVENSADVIDEMDFEQAVEEVSEQISADSLYCNNRTQSGVINEIIEVIATAYTTEHSCLKVGGDNVDIALVRKRLKSLDSGHIEYVLECIGNNCTVIKNRKNYLLTCLFKAPVTMDGYYSSQVAYDLARGS